MLKTRFPAEYARIVAFIRKLNPKADDLTRAVDAVAAMATSADVAAGKLIDILAKRKARGPGDDAAEKADWKNVLSTLGKEVLTQARMLRLISRQLNTYRRSVARAGQGLLKEFENLQSRLRVKV